MSIPAVGTGRPQFPKADVTAGSISPARAGRTATKPINEPVSASAVVMRLIRPLPIPSRLTHSTNCPTTEGMRPIHVIGGGLAGSEAAWQIANRGLAVVLHEMRPVRGTAAHKTDGL